jgi:hypothetical protein
MLKENGRTLRATYPHRTAQSEYDKTTYLYSYWQLGASWASLTFHLSRTLPSRPKLPNVSFS